MSTAMDWSHDFCLSCDNVNQTDGPYCSEACRLSDLGRSAESAPHPPLCSGSSYSSTASNYSWSTALSPSRSSGMHLAPAVNFSALRAPTASASVPNCPHMNTSKEVYFAAAPHHSNPSNPIGYHHPQSQRSLTTSSSRSSLSSMSTTSSNSHGFSDQTIYQLRDYANFFDQSRNQRRMTG